MSTQSGDIIQQPRGFTITITGDEQGRIKAHDSRNNITDEFAGVMIILGDVAKNAFSHFSWGHYQSIVYGMYGSIMDAKNDKSEVGEHHRTILGMVSRMIMELYGYFRKTKHMTPEEALEKWEAEDREEPIKWFN